jgi:hypothetical protein
MHHEKIVSCLGEPKSVVIPSTVREIGEKAFHSVESLVELSSEEGVERIRFAAFFGCSHLEVVAFPASLLVIDERAFYNCLQLRKVTYAADSQLQYIGKQAFVQCHLGGVFLPACVTEIDPDAFSSEVWQIVKSNFLVRPEGWRVLKSPFLVNKYFLGSLDSRTMIRCLSSHHTLVVPAHIEVIGKSAFYHCSLSHVIFPNGSRLREIGEEAFSRAQFLRAITVPSSVEILGDRCFEYSENLATVTFEEPSKLETIGERVFAFSAIKSITIPTSVKEIDWSAFAGCPLEQIYIDPGNRRFVIRENALLTSDGKEIVKYLGQEREVFVPSEVEELRRSCFESLQCLTELKFESESQLRKICRSALSGCESLRCIIVPASVTEIEEFAFKECIGLEDCSIHKGAMLVRVGQEAFAGCSSLRSFYVPKTIEGIGGNCFNSCPSLYRLKFESRHTLKRIVRDRTLDEALEDLGFTEISGLFRIEVEDDRSGLLFPGWIPVADASSHLTLAPDF